MGAHVLRRHIGGPDRRVRKKKKRGGKILGPDSRGMCYFYIPELPDVLVIANDCTKRTQRLIANEIQ